MGFANNDLVQSAIEAQIANEENNEEEYLDFNPLQLYFGDDYVVNDKITIHQPSIQDYITYGEENIQSVIYPFISNTTKCRLQLWNNGIDWNDITNQQLFSILIKSIDLEYSKLMFGDIDFHGFSFFTEEKDGKESVILYNPIQDIKCVNIFNICFMHFRQKRNLLLVRLLKEILLIETNRICWR